MNLRTILLIFTLSVSSFLKGDDEDQTCQAGGSEQCVPSIESSAKIPRGANERGLPPEVDIAKCVDRHKMCMEFQSWGECDKNPGWMIVFCAKSCNACHLLDPKVRCDRERLQIDTNPAYKPGDMNKMFNSIVDRFSDTYKINVISTDPWVVTFDNFVSDIEIEAILATNEGKYERSTDTGSSNAYGESGRILSQGRTSSNSWCRNECENHPDVMNVMSKIEEVVNIPRDNYESFQVLQYTEGQHYSLHHDMSEDDNRLACGPRILTFFLYLSDVEEGGETAFPSLGIKVKPAKGKALLWPSTLNENPHQKEHRTNHQALPVIKGVKYAANAWIHLYNYMVPNLWGCTGAFD